MFLACFLVKRNHITRLLLVRMCGNKHENEEIEQGLALYTDFGW